jgi:hypothetical protein
MRKILVVVVAGILVSGGVLASTSFKGQGTIKFDKVSTANISVSNTLTVKKISGLGTMVTKAGFAKQSELNAWADLLLLTAEAAIANNNYQDCISTLAQYTTYVMSSDVLTCWNAYMTGTASTASVNSDRLKEALQPGQPK